MGGGGEGGVKHNVKMTLFSAKIVWTSPLNTKVKLDIYKRFGKFGKCVEFI